MKSPLFTLSTLAMALTCSMASIAEESGKVKKLKTVKVEADAEITVRGYKATNSTTATKTDTPLMETPVSVQIISREIMNDQQVLSIKDAVKNISGVYTRSGPDGNTMDGFNIRGFDAESYGSTYLDGVKDFSRAPKETAGLERIEVLKGPSAIMYGRIEPGGMINRVSKKPQVDQFTHLQQQLGSHNYLRTTVDSNGSLSDEDWLYRVNIAIEDGDGFKDDTHNRRIYLAPQIAWQAGDNTNINTGVEYQKNNRSWALTYGTIGDANGPLDIPISTNLHDKDDFYKDDSVSWNLSWVHQFNDDWKIQQRVSYVDRSSVAEGSGLSAAEEDGTYTRDFWGWKDEEAQIASTNIDLNGKFETGNINHNLLVGIDFFDEDYDSGGWSYGGTSVVTNVHNPDRDSAPYDADHDVEDFGYNNKNTGLYIQDQMSLLDERLHIMIGTRYDKADYDSFFSTYPPNVSKDKTTTWRGGVLYKVTESTSIYTSYVEGFGSPNTSNPSDGIKFDPQTSHQYEIGTKIELTPEIGITLAAFQLIKDNLTMADPEDITKTILAGEATSEGFELDITGQINDYWNVIAAYAYTDVRFTRSDTLQGERMHSVPRHGASFWSTYDFGNSGWKTGGGIVYRSERLGTQRAWAPDLYPYMLDAYTLIDLMLAYDFEISNLPVTAQLNISNATDERYYPSTYGDNQRIALGEPRNIMGSIKVQF